MRGNSYISYLLTDLISLSAYQEGEDVTLDDIKRRLMIIGRKHNKAIPDHYLRLVSNYTFKGIRKKSQAFTKGLTQLAEHFLEKRENRIYVKIEKFNEWQEQITYIPPMLLICSYIFRTGKFSEGEISTDSFYNLHIAPNLRYTSLIPPYIPQLEELKKEQHGFNDLHIHLNGTMETDSVWLDILKHPDSVFRNILKNTDENELVKEQYEQFDNWTHPDKLKTLIIKAIDLRKRLFSDIWEGISVPEKFTRQSESLLYVSVLYFLWRNPESETVTKCFHHYLLILGLINRILVHQAECFGFEQFQKYTLNKLRDYSEEEYTKRFFQLAGNQLDNIRVMEGRFSPKETIEKNDELIDKIRKGWLNFNQKQKDHDSELRLIAHFIKRKKEEKEKVRFRNLRNRNRKICENLISIHNSGSKNGKAIVGIDVAASEFDTPPEVYAPIFKKLRENGFIHFTYHAGEDFYHLLGGLRAVYEAIIFLDLQRGDRIGHATAAGIDPEIWYKNVGDKIMVQRGAYLDDLLFVYYLSNFEEGKALRPLMPRLNLRIIDIASSIYPDIKFHTKDLINAWMKRQEDIIEIYDKGELSKYPLLEQYHDKECIERYEKQIIIDTYEILDRTAIKEVQLAILQLMHKKEIVIETLPTSNIYIGNHHSYTTYHLVNWIKWAKEENPIPPIVLGTDDAGIFATNIYNEYCHIYTLLVHEYNFSTNEALEIIKRINYNTNIYSFK